MRALSGGMKRRVLVAQALVHKPPVIILDEPTAGVDVELRQGLWQFIRQLNGDGHTIVLTTHYLEEAEALCSRVGMLKQGKLVALDSTHNLLKGFMPVLTCGCGWRTARLPESLRPMLAASQTSGEYVLALHDYARGRNGTGPAAQERAGSGRTWNLNSPISKKSSSQIMRRE